jgi:hypothetical protein
MARVGLGASIITVIAAISIAFATAAQASVGYELDATHPSRSLGESLPRGMAVDQANGRIYVAIESTEAREEGSSAFVAPGEVDRFESDLTAAGVFSNGSQAFYSGVAVNPVTQGFYAVQAKVHLPLGAIGASKMDQFSSSGTLATTFGVADTETAPQIATDASGDVYYPNSLTNSVQVFDSTGALQEEITCDGCTGGPFGKPSSVALGPAGDLYVVDAEPDRVLKLARSGGVYAFAALLQSGRGAAAVGVDPSEGEVFVGDLPNGKDYHVVAYDSAGAQFDDFGAGLFAVPPEQLGSLVAGQIAVDSSTHRLYVGDFGKFYVFDKVTIAPPTLSTKPATAIEQLGARLRATANTNGHAALGCAFEYVDDVDFQASGFAGATSLPCPKKPDGLNDTPLEAKASGLSPGVGYHYRASVSTNAGAVTSNASSFETLPAVPSTVTMEQPLGITQSGATLRARVNPHGGSVSECRFEYGTSTAYGATLPCPISPQAVTTDVAESGQAFGLALETTYHYRLVVSTNAGTTVGSDVEFQTASPPSLPSLPNAPTPTPAPPAPVSSGAPRAPAALHCRKGFQKKRVRGKQRCVKRKRRTQGRHRRG